MSLYEVEKQTNEEWTKCQDKIKGICKVETNKHSFNQSSLDYGDQLQ